MPNRSTTPRWIRFAAAAACLNWIGMPAAANSPQYPWVGRGDFRVLVRIDAPARRVERADEQPAEVVLDFDALLAQPAPGRRPDLNSVQVIRQDSRTGEPLQQGAFAFATDRWDIPWRWYDAAIPYDFPEVETNISSTEGELRYVGRPRFGYYYDCIGDWRQGHLAFLHRSQDDRPAIYAIYFQLLPEGNEPQSALPRGFLGDGLNRCEPKGDSSTSLIHSRIDVVDWRGRGGHDLLVGCSRGGVVVYLDRGASDSPKYPCSKLVTTRDGKPMDVGWGAAPRCVDWDHDGLFDLIVGGERNRILYFRNCGTRQQPAFEYRGLLKSADGQVLALPTTPVPEGEDVFNIDYYPMLETVDWDGDGDIDLLAGGYITGRIYFYENQAPAGAEPTLTLRGPLEADGRPIDVQWGAAPAIADLDDDGDLDLISGSMPMTVRGGDAASSERFLYYFRNDGTQTAPKLHALPLPHDGTFPLANLASPRLVDWNRDGVLDLIVSANQQIYLYQNIGTRRNPRFDVRTGPLPGYWGSATLGCVQFLDWNGDGLVDGANGPQIYLNTGKGSPGMFASPVSLLAEGQKISHLSGIGDDWQYQRLYDLDNDRQTDLLDADHGGHIWWHPNRQTNSRPRFDSEGIRLQLVDGQPVTVGLNREGFEKLQGARATYTVADFDRDSHPDLVVVDNFGVVRFFRQSSAKVDGQPRFEPAIELGKLPIRGVPDAADWNGDGWTDLIAGSDADHVVVFCNRQNESGPVFAPAEPISLPGAPYGAGGPIAVADYNGDGDADIVLQTAYGYTCFYERSFIEAGYAKASVIEVQKR